MDSEYRGRLVALGLAAKRLGEEAAAAPGLLERVAELEAKVGRVEELVVVWKKTAADYEDLGDTWNAAAVGSIARTLSETLTGPEVKT